MMHNQYDIKVILRFDVGFPAGLLGRCVYLIEDSFYRSEIAEFDLWFEDIKNFFNLSGDKVEESYKKAREELAEYKGWALRVEKASEGSILFDIGFIDVVMPVLQLIFGQMLYDFLKKTSLYKKIGDLLLKKVEDIGKGIQTSTSNDDELKRSNVRTDVKIDKLNININVNFPADLKPRHIKGEIIKRIVDEIIRGEDDDYPSSGNRARGRIKN